MRSFHILTSLRADVSQLFEKLEMISAIQRRSASLNKGSVSVSTEKSISSFLWYRKYDL